MLKLVRLARMPRLLKLLDPERFKKVVRGFEPAEADINQIVNRDSIMFAYSMLRLCIILLLLTYGFGCVQYFMSDMLNSDEAVEAGATLIETYSMRKNSDSDNLVTIWYFALTTLSTVGYGDYAPVSSLEMLAVVVVQLCGVAIFSFIMDSFMQLMANFQRRIGIVDRSD